MALPTFSHGSWDHAQPSQAIQIAIGRLSKKRGNFRYRKPDYLCLA